MLDSSMQKITAISGEVDGIQKWRKKPHAKEEQPPAEEHKEEISDLIAILFNDVI